MEPSRSFWRLHLLSWLATGVVGLTLIIANVAGRLNVYPDGAPLVTIALISQRTVSWQHGWPLTWLDRFSLIEQSPGVPAASSPFPVDGAEATLHWLPLVLDIMAGLVLLAGTAAFVELCLANRWLTSTIRLRTMFILVVSASVVFLLIRQGHLSWEALFHAPLYLGILATALWVIVWVWRRMRVKVDLQADGRDGP